MALATGGTNDEPLPFAPDPDRIEVSRGRSPPDGFRQNQDYASDRHDESRVPSTVVTDSDRSSSSSPSLHFPIYGRPPGPVIYKLFENAKHRDGTEKSSSVTLEPDVMYAVNVYDVDAKSDRTPKAQYRHSKPLVFDRVADEKTISSSIDSDPLPPREEFRASWTGPIITIWHFAHARFPQRTERLEQNPSNLNQESVQRQTGDDDFDALSFKSVTPGRLHIQSPFLYRRLSSLAGYYPSFFETGSGNLQDMKLTHWSHLRVPKVIAEPWCFLIHRFPLIEASVNDVDSNDAQTKAPDDAAGSIAHLEMEHTRQLYRFLKPYYKGIVEPIVAQLAQDSPQLPFNMLWYIFAPGTDVYVSSGNSFQAMVVKSIRSNVEMAGNHTPIGSQATAEEIRLKLNLWVLDLWYLDAVGSKVGRVERSVELMGYEGTRPIKSLMVCPTSIWDRSDQGSRRRRIISRSKLLLKTLKAGHMLANYNGPIGGTDRHVSTIILMRRGIFADSHSTPAR